MEDQIGAYLKHTMPYLEYDMYLTEESQLPKTTMIGGGRSRLASFELFYPKYSVLKSAPSTLAKPLQLVPEFWILSH